MARHVPSVFAEKVKEVQAEVDRVRTLERRAFEVSTEVLPGVRLVSTRDKGTSIVFSLWLWETDVAELCGDAAYPATGGLLAIDREQIAALSRVGVAGAASRRRTRAVAAIFTVRANSTPTASPAR